MYTRFFNMQIYAMMQDNSGSELRSNWQHSNDSYNSENLNNLLYLSLNLNDYCHAFTSLLVRNMV